MSETNEEINQAITEKLFGKCWHKLGGFEGAYAYCRKCRNEISFHKQTTLGMENRNYAESIADAFLVVEEMERRGISWHFIGAANRKSYVVRFETKFASVESAETLPRDICLAALAAIEAVEARENRMENELCEICDEPLNGGKYDVCKDCEQVLREALKSRKVVTYHEDGRVEYHNKEAQGAPNRGFMSDKKSYADMVFEGFGALCWIEDSLDDMFSHGELHHIGHDHYDRSIELYFTSNVPSDFDLTIEQVSEIVSWGFDGIYCNFTDGTESLYSKGGSNRQRAKVSHPRWSVEQEQNMGREF